MVNTSNTRRRISIISASAASVAALVIGVVPPTAASAAAPAAVPTGDVISVVNTYRAMSGLAPIESNGWLQPAAEAHSCYMLQNGIAHDEVPGRPGYTAAGDAAGNSSNVAVSSAITMTDNEYVDLWMTGPFHAIGLLRHNLTSIGYGTCTNPATNPYHSAASLDVLSGLSSASRPAEPIVWPGNGSTTSLDHFVAESPNPVQLCGWPSGGGLPVIAMMPEPADAATATMTGPTGPLEVCALSAGNVADADARAILGADNAVTVVPRNRLDPGTYTVTVTTRARSVNWSFTVGTVNAAGSTSAPAADPVAPVAPTPVVDTSVSGAAGGFTAVAPTRLVDTRLGTGGPRLQAGIVRRIQVTGRTLPLGTTAVSANVTGIGAERDGFIAAFACTSTAPTVSTVNFAAGTIVANAAIVPLDATGGICLLSNVAVDVVIDINGFVSPQSAGRLVPTAALRVFDTRSGGSVSRLVGGTAVEVSMTDTGSVPRGATAVVLNVTAMNAEASTFITAYPCSAERPTVSSLNMVGSDPQSNTVIVPLSDTGSVCFYSPSDVDLIADLSGYMIVGEGLRYTPLAAVRLVDTRDPQTALNLGLGGARMDAGSTLTVPFAGSRGIPAEASVVAVNITTTATSGTGFVTAWSCAADRPNVSALNAIEGLAVSAAASAQVSSQGALCLFAQPTTHLVVDISGFWAK